jgi:P63C domain
MPLKKIGSDLPSIGGKARAKKLSPQEKSDIAKFAAEARWAKHPDRPHLAKAINEGPLHIGDAVIDCAVLEDETRVINQRSFLKAVNRSTRPSAGTGSETLNQAFEQDWGVEELPPFLPSQNLKPFISKELMMSKNPIPYKPLRGGRIAFGYKAELLPMVCYAYIDADKAKAIRKDQKHMVVAAEKIVRGLATVGIIALIDEATGYQAIRDRLALQKILDAYLLKEFAAWAKRFPDEFYIELFRLRGWEWKGMSVNRPQVVGRLTNDLVYERLAPGVLDELKKRNPVVEAGYRRQRHHQWLTKDIGNPALAQHLYATVALMKASKDWHSFMMMMNRALPPKRGQLPLLLTEGD